MVRKIGADWLKEESKKAKTKIVTPQPNYTEWLIRALAFIGGAGSTVIGSWISSKIRLFHDDQKSHHQELKQKILLPLRDLLVQHEALFKHQAPAIAET